MGHFGRENVITQLENRFYWPGLKKDAERFVQRSPICQETKGIKQNTELYMTLPVASELTSLWILFVVYLVPKLDLILFLWLWTDFPRWLIFCHEKNQ